VALDGIVRRVEIQTMAPEESSRHRVNGLAPAGSEYENKPPRPGWVRTHHITILSLDADARLVDMQQAATAQPFGNIVICAR